VPLPYEQQPGESARAFRAFQIYRDLGPDRSLDKAYADYTANESATELPRSPGQWNRWSAAHNWVERALEYDAHLDAQKRKRRERRMLELEDRRFECEIRNQEELERIVDQLNGLIEKSAACPVADVVQVTDETVEDISLARTTRTKKKTTVKALKASGLARLVQERNDTARQTVVGVREPVKEKKNAQASSGGIPTGIVFKPPIDPNAVPA